MLLYLSDFNISLNIDKLRLKFSYEKLPKQGKPGPSQWTVLGKKRCSSKELINRTQMVRIVERTNAKARPFYFYDLGLGLLRTGHCDVVII